MRKRVFPFVFGVLTLFSASGVGAQEYAADDNPSLDRILPGIRERHPSLYTNLWRLDRRTAGWPLLRNLGDHFLIVLRKS